MREVRARGLRYFGLSALVLLVVVAVWWAAGRLTAEGRRLAVRELPGLVEGKVSREPSGGGIRILAWNIAHGRGDVQEGWTNNWRGGSSEERTARLAGIARVLAEADAPIVVLNEVDFDARWSGGLNMAEVLARAAGYPFRVEQRNYDVQLPFFRLAFGNAVLSRFPIRDVEWVHIPPHSGLESMAIGAKAASLVRIALPGGNLSLVPVHLEVRSRATRLAALPALEELEAQEPGPVILAGDFNSAPSGWPGAPEGTLLDSLLAAGWTSPRARGSPSPHQLTFPTPGLRDARDWILVEPPLKIVEVRVLTSAGHLSDHLPVLATIVRSPEPEP